MDKDSCFSTPEYEYIVIKPRKTISIPFFVFLSTCTYADKLINSVHCSPKFNVLLFFSVRQNKYIGCSCSVTTWHHLGFIVWYISLKIWNGHCYSYKKKNPNSLTGEVDVCVQCCLALTNSILEKSRLQRMVFTYSSGGGKWKCYATSHICESTWF